MGILVIADHDNSALNSTTLNIVTAAKKIGDDVSILVMGAGCQAVADEAAKIAGISKVLLADAEHLGKQLAENIAEIIRQQADGYTHILTAANTNGKNYMPRVAALLDMQQISEIIEVVSADTFKRPIYAGNAIATVQSSDAIKLITVRGTSFEAASAEGGSAAVETVESGADTGKSVFVGRELSESDRPELTSARVVISGGRGIGSADNFKVLSPLADKLSAAIGASRAAVDSGFAPNDWQVGQTGKVVAPELYIAVGISGAIQHLAGMKDSKVIVAINKDEEAPIFQVADYGLVGDLFDILPQIDSALS